jgi:hypothetical protein
MSLIPETLHLFLPAKRKQTPSGWISFNAVCCADKRQRGGFIVNEGDAVTYHCFHCGFKASWQPGRQLSKNMKALMRHLGIADDTITKVSFEAIKLLNEQTMTLDNQIIPKFDTSALPLDAQPILNYIDNTPEKLLPVLNYLNSRGLYLEDYNFHWTHRTGFNNRLIIPFYYQNNIVGYTARAVNEDKTRYLSEQQPGYVFNLDKQHDDRKFIIVCEGPLDAISIDGCALLGSEIKDQQNYLLQQVHKQLVLVPDRDKAGQKVIKQALEYGWSVSMPDYPDGIKDVNDCVVKLGRLATLYLIVQSIQSNPLKIQLREKQWFKDKQ